MKITKQQADRERQVISKTVDDYILEAGCSRAFKLSTMYFFKRLLDEGSPLFLETSMPFAKLKKKSECQIMTPISINNYLRRNSPR